MEIILRFILFAVYISFVFFCLFPIVLVIILGYKQISIPDINSYIKQSPNVLKIKKTFTITFHLAYLLYYFKDKYTELRSNWIKRAVEDQKDDLWTKKLLQWLEKERSLFNEVLRYFIAMSVIFAFYFLFYIMSINSNGPAYVILANYIMLYSIIFALAVFYAVIADTKTSKAVFNIIIWGFGLTIFSNQVIRLITWLLNIFEWTYPNLEQHLITIVFINGIARLFVYGLERIQEQTKSLNIERSMHDINFPSWSLRVFSLYKKILGVKSENKNAY